MKKFGVVLSLLLLFALGFANHPHKDEYSIELGLLSLSGQDVLDYAVQTNVIDDGWFVQGAPDWPSATTGRVIIANDYEYKQLLFEVNGEGILIVVQVDEYP